MEEKRGDVHVTDSLLFPGPLFTISLIRTATRGRQIRKLRLKEVQEAQGHTVSKWQDCNWKVVPSGCKAPVSCLDHTDCGYYVKTLTVYLIPITYLILTATPGAGTLMNPTSQRRNWRLWDLPEDIQSVRGRARIPACAHQHCTGSPLQGRGFRGHR